jgi:hypothetical protein
MLLNVVKLRYMDPPLFLNVQQVVQQYTLAGSGSILAPGSTGNATIAPAESATGSWAESPTITYNPMSGEQFTKSLLQPVSPADLVSLVEADWPVDAVFGIGVRSINGLHAGSRTQMLKRPGDPDFYRVLPLLRELQASDAFGMRVEETKEGVPARSWCFAPSMSKKRKISKNKMATLLKTSRTQVDRLFNPKSDITLSSLQRAVAMVGRRVTIELA